MVSDSVFELYQLFYNYKSPSYIRGKMVGVDTVDDDQTDLRGRTRDSYYVDENSTDRRIKNSLCSAGPKRCASCMGCAWGREYCRRQAMKMKEESKP